MLSCVDSDRGSHVPYAVLLFTFVAIHCHIHINNITAFNILITSYIGCIFVVIYIAIIGAIIGVIVRVTVVLLTSAVILTFIFTTHCKIMIHIISLTIFIMSVFMFMFTFIIISFIFIFHEIFIFITMPIYTIGP